MSNRNPFQYALLRYVHDAVTGEFLNIGLVMFSKPARFFRAQLLSQYGRVSGMFPNVDGEFYQRYAKRLQTAFDQLASKIEDPQSALLADLSSELAAVIQTVLPHDDSAFQFSEARGGAARDLAAFFEHTYARTVTQYLEKRDSATRSDEDVWAAFRKPLQVHKITQHLVRHTVSTPYGDQEFDHAAKNGKWHLMEPTSFDLALPTSIRKKALMFDSMARVLHDHAPDAVLHILVGAPTRDDAKVQRAFHDVQKLFKERTQDIGNVDIVEEKDAEKLAVRMQRLMAGEHST